MEQNIKQLADWIRGSSRMVFFGGAGVSTESGVPDFRSQDGLYRQAYRYPPEMIISHSFFMQHPDEFFRFYRDRMLYPDAQPNAAHKALAKLEQMGKLRAVITQNIDGLHQKAGSKHVLELHGSVLRNHCMHCGKFFGLDAILKSEGVPHCDACGGIIKPDVVLYEEALDHTVMEQALRYLSEADVLIVGGTSLVVYPAAGLIDAYRGNRLALINRDQTARDDLADLIIHRPIGEVFTEVMDLLAD